MDIAKLRTFIRALPTELSNTFVTGRRAASEVLHAQAHSLGRKLGLDHFDEPLATGKLADPAVMTATDRVIANRPVHGRLYVDGISERDVAQGMAGDCYFLATLASIASTHPELIERAIARNDDGTVTVTFNAPGGKQVPITVDADLPRLDAPLVDGATVYGGSTTPGELWPALVEKAYAQWRGGYDAIGNGGYPTDAMLALAGTANSTYLSGLDPSAVAKLIAEKAAAKTPMTGTTKTTTGIPGVVGNHVYSVDGAEQHGGQWYVRLRNPWAFGEPLGLGPNDGAFLLPAKDFLSDFTYLTTS